MKLISKIILFGILFSFSKKINAQSTEYFLNYYQGQNQINYFQPFADVLTSQLNNGFTNRMPLDDKFHIGLKVIGSASIFPGSKLKTFTPINENGEALSFSVPTVIGDPNAVVDEHQNGTATTYLPGTGSRYIPLLAPQLNIGNFFGTSISFRYLPYNLKSEGEKFGWFGVGINHNLGRYFMKDENSFLVAHVAYQNVNISNYFDLTTQRVTLNYGKQWDKVYINSFLGYQSGNLNADFDFENSDGEMENFLLTLPNNNKIVGGLGAGLKLSVLSINTEFTFLQPTVLSLSVGLAL